ncbi:uncharacterized protein LOC111641387 [Centruroides sculpturatus]|uniref:uncharacterized protein LOC111641387 n=1 Tax=Centruroides sculpturatus TaxID=218467 RepID=UPI000C6DA197|nr:uncharacterized protein LOC111641387 [Centruroides sculpturatus]
MYCPRDISMENTVNMIQNILNKFNNVKFILAGDKHPLTDVGRGSRRPAGEIFEEFITSNGLVLLNNSLSPPTYISSQGKTWINVTACSQDCADDLENWHVCITKVMHTCQFCAYTSDHTYISYLLKNISSNITSNSTDLINHRRKSVPWWNTRLTDLCRTNNILRRYQTCRIKPTCTTLKQQYHNHKTLYKKEIKEAKINSWQQFCTAASTNPWGYLTRMCTNKLWRTQILVNEDTEPPTTAL